jgi:hypothetical protein
MKKLIPLLAALALTFGAVTAFAGKSAPSATKATSAKGPKAKKATKS